MIELTATEALCIINRGWSTQTEQELGLYAQEVVAKEAKRLHLEYQKQLIVEELKQFEEPTLIQPVAQDDEYLKWLDDNKDQEWAHSEATEVSTS